MLPYHLYVNKNNAVTVQIRKDDTSKYTQFTSLEKRLTLKFPFSVDFVLDLERYCFEYNLFLFISDKQWHVFDWYRVRRYHAQCNISFLRYRTISTSTLNVQVGITNYLVSTFDWNMILYVIQFKLHFNFSNTYKNDMSYQIKLYSKLSRLSFSL